MYKIYVTSLLYVPCSDALYSPAKGFLQPLRANAKSDNPLITEENLKVRAECTVVVVVVMCERSESLTGSLFRH